MKYRSKLEDMDVTKYEPNYQYINDKKMMEDFNKAIPPENKRIFDKIMTEYEDLLLEFLLNQAYLEEGEFNYFKNYIKQRLYTTILEIIFLNHKLARETYKQLIDL